MFYNWIRIFAMPQNAYKRQLKTINHFPSCIQTAVWTIQIVELKLKREICKWSILLSNTNYMMDVNWSWMGSLSLYLCDLVDRCDPVPELANALPDSEMALRGSSVNYSCYFGYRLVVLSSNSLTCDGSNWIGAPQCECKEYYTCVNYYFYCYLTLQFKY